MWKPVELLCVVVDVSLFKGIAVFTTTTLLLLLLLLLLLYE